MNALNNYDSLVYIIHWWEAFIHSTALVAYTLADSLQTLYFKACSAYRTLPSLSGRHRFADITPTNQKRTASSRLHELHYTTSTYWIWRACVFLHRTSSLKLFTCRSASNSAEDWKRTVLTWLLTLCNCLITNFVFCGLCNTPMFF